LAIYFNRCVVKYEIKKSGERKTTTWRREVSIHFIKFAAAGIYSPEDDRKGSF
jgi:hypothetical protein